MIDIKDEILKQEYFKYYRDSLPSDERTNEVVDLALCVKEETQAIKNAMDENGRRMCLDLLEYMANNNVRITHNVKKQPIFEYKCEWITAEQLFDNFL